ncbi:SDR family NAD(P)-dependent oxidoreductase, partial [Paraburkholderia sp. SIMBA_049]
MTDDSSSLPLAVITGGAGHIGLSCARRFRDHRILISDLQPDAVASAVSTLQAEGLNAFPMPADITRRADANTLAEATNGMGGFAVLIHAAGVAPPTPPEFIYAVNLYGTINILDAFEPLVKPGVVGVCVASMAGHRRLGHRFDSLLLEPTQGPADLARAIEVEAPTTPKHRLAYATSKRGTILQVQR